MEAALKERVEKRAYDLFRERGGDHGYAIDDWLRAEKEVLVSGAEGKAQKRNSPRREARAR
jgi:hypothetical protein